MELTKEEIKELEGKKLLIITNKNFTYNCLVLSSGEDYVHIRDKYDKQVFIKVEEINLLEVLG